MANVSLPPRPGSDPNRKPITLPDLEATAPLKKYMTRSSLKKELREQVKATKRHKKSGRDSRTVLCAQVDTEMLRAQGYKVSNSLHVSIQGSAQTDLYPGARQQPAHNQNVAFL